MSIMRTKTFNRRVAVFGGALVVASLGLLWWLAPDQTPNPEACTSSPVIITGEDYNHFYSDFHVHPSLDCKEWTKGGTCVEEELIPDVFPDPEDAEPAAPAYDQVVPAPHGSKSVPVTRIAPVIPIPVWPWPDGNRTLAPVKDKVCDVPEPASWLLVLLGGVALIACRRLSK